MNLCNAIQTVSLDIIETLVSKDGFTTDSNWRDYDALNSAVKCGRKDVVKLLLQKNCRVNKTVKGRADTPLHNAVRLADPELVSDLLKSKASVVAYDADHNSPLHLAFLLKQENLVDIMLGSIERDSQYYNSKNNQGLTHLHVACTRSNGKVIESFLNKEASARDTIKNTSVVWAGYNSLHFAAEFKSLTALKILSSYNSFRFSLLKVRENRLGQTPMQLINKHLEELSIMASLLNGSRFSHFHMACAGNDARLVKSFLGNGANANQRVLFPSESFCFFFTPLHFAVESKNDENVEMLLKCGAITDSRNNDDMTPVQLVLYNHKPVRINQTLYDATQDKLCQAPDNNGLSFMHVACAKNDVMMVKQYLDRGEDINSEVSYHRQLLYRYTPLHFAVKYENLEMVKYLIQRGAAVNSSENCVDGSPLHVACEFGYTDIIDYLLEQGADAKAVRQRDQKTMCHLFIDYYSRLFGNFRTTEADIIRKLVKLGCDVNAKDGNRNTALHQVSTSEHLTKILLDIGADINIENDEGNTPFDALLFRFSFGSNILLTKMLLYHHVQELKMIGRAVNPKNEACCERVYQELNCQEEELANKQQERINEIDKMKKIKLNNDVSLYDFVQLEPLQARNFVIHETLMDVLQKEFPVYGYLLKLQNLKVVDSADVEAEGSSMKRVVVKTEPDEGHSPSKRHRAE